VQNYTNVVPYTPKIFPKLLILLGFVVPYDKDGLARGAGLTSVRDNLRHASIATTSIYLHGDDLKRAKQMGSAFLARE